MASLVSAFAFDFLFIPPYESFTVIDTWYLVTALTFMCIAVLGSILTTAIRRHAVSASRREAYTAALYAMTQALATTRRPEEVLRAASKHIKSTFGFDIAVLLANENGELVTRMEPPGSGVGTSVRAGAESAFQIALHNPITRREGSFVPLRTAERVIGLIVLMPAHSQSPLGSADDMVLEGIAGQVAAAIERANLEEQARAAELMRKTDELQRTLLNSVSHSLRAPLAAILSAIDPIAEGQAGDRSAIMELARIAQSEASRLDTLIGNLLDLSRLESGALELRVEPHDVKDVLGAALRQLHDQQDRKILLETDARLPLVLIDFALIVNVLVNLLENAIKYSTAGSPINIDARLAGSEIEIRVADRGYGVPPLERKAIFGKFARGSGASRTPGIGLGLPICKGFVEAHRGRIWVEDRPGGGSLFCFTLPAFVARSRDPRSGGWLRPPAETES
jgi:two-component system sensor histidine kinase KdpD